MAPPHDPSFLSTTSFIFSVMCLAEVGPSPINVEACCLGLRGGNRAYSFLFAVTYAAASTSFYPAHHDSPFILYSILRVTYKTSVSGRMTVAPLCKRWNLSG